MRVCATCAGLWDISPISDNLTTMELQVHDPGDIWKLKEKVLDAQLTTHGAPPQFISPAPIQLPPQRTKPEHQINGLIKRELPAPLVDIRLMREMHTKLEAQIAAKRRDVVSHSEAYNSIVDLLTQPADSREQTVGEWRENLRLTGEAKLAYQRLVFLQREIVALQKQLAGLCAGKKLVHAESWWSTYDELWSQKLEIQRCMLGCVIGRSAE